MLARTSPVVDLASQNSHAIASQCTKRRLSMLARTMPVGDSTSQNSHAIAGCNRTRDPHLASTASLSSNPKPAHRSSEADRDLSLLQKTRW
ncbi:hypothetical protein GOP47_0020816 [Adiantum capillus-veneris]|uniref:Uncharacterized protein n=1 Tax=Adiantum capillus-veneris TaxID=13818 RepID=A0A9D4U9W1_ADICA|nr:hypothetical protein GOP47_0020816 [Adiantum capillus-veneris]